MTDDRYESFLAIAASYLALIIGILCYIATREKWTILICIFAGLGFAWVSERANQRVITTEDKK